MHLTVAICTRNRCASLGNTLASLARLRVPDGVSWDVLVADNGSRDATASTIARFAQALPISALDVPEVGKSNALNAAMQRASGEFALWIDDDVVVDTDWLLAYHSAFRSWPSAAFFGGPISPVFEGRRPAWLTGALQHVGNAYAALDLGPEMIPLGTDALPFGANWAVRLSEQRRHPYDPRLGPRGESQFYGEEWAVMQALLATGASGRWVPAARVQHVIPQARQTIRYLRRYYTGNGRSLALVRRHDNETVLFGRPRWLWREAFAQELAYQVRRLYARPDQWSEHLRRAIDAAIGVEGRRVSSTMGRAALVSRTSSSGPRWASSRTEETSRTINAKGRSSRCLRPRRAETARSCDASTAR